MNGEVNSSQKEIKWLLALLILALVLIVTLITLISAGFFDPKPIGVKLASSKLAPIQIDENPESISWLDHVPPQGDFTIRLNAGWSSGELDSGFGLVLGSPENAVIMALSPLGYLSIWQENLAQTAARKEIIISWQTWPHVQTEGGVNEIWIDVQDNLITTIRINRELLQVEPIPQVDRGVGLWAGTFGGSVEFDFSDVEIFGQPE